MKILQLSHRLPWPPIDGGKKGTLGFASGYRSHCEVECHKILCICPIEEIPWSEDWLRQPDQLQIDPMDVTNRAVDVLLNTAFSSLPFNMAKYNRKSFARIIESELERMTPDVVHFDSLHTACYAPLVHKLAPKALKVLRCHNAEHVIMERYADLQSNPLRRAIVNMQAKRLRKYEARSLDDFDLILAITNADAERFKLINPSIENKIRIVPAGVNLPEQLPSTTLSVGPIQLIHIAAMDWLPNQVGLRWLLERVLPRLDREGVDYRLDVIGKNMPEDFMRYNSSKVTVHGFVQDLKPLTDRAQLALVPLQAGGGMRVKILDYWSLGIPVLSTSIGAEGLLDESREVIRIADSESDFATQIEYLSARPEAREKIRNAGFEKAAEAYGWPSIVDSLVSSYREMIRT